MNLKTVWLIWCIKCIFLTMRFVYLLYLSYKYSHIKNLLESEWRFFHWRNSSQQEIANMGNEGLMRSMLWHMGFDMSTKTTTIFFQGMQSILCMCMHLMWSFLGHYMWRYKCNTGKSSKDPLYPQLREGEAGMLWSFLFFIFLNEKVYLTI